MKVLFIIVLTCLFSFITYADELSINVGNKIFESENFHSADDICKYYKYKNSGKNEWASKDGSKILLSNIDSTFYGQRVIVILNESERKIAERLRELRYNPVVNPSSILLDKLEEKPYKLFQKAKQYCALYKEGGNMKLIFYRIRPQKKLL